MSMELSVVAREDAYEEVGGEVEDGAAAAAAAASDGGGASGALVGRTSRLFREENKRNELAGGAGPGSFA